MALSLEVDKGENLSLPKPRREVTVKNWMRALTVIFFLGVCIFVFGFPPHHEEIERVVPISDNNNLGERFLESLPRRSE